MVMYVFVALFTLLSVAHMVLTVVYSKEPIQIIFAATGLICLLILYLPQKARHWVYVQYLKLKGDI